MRHPRLLRLPPLLSLALVPLFPLARAAEADRAGEEARLLGVLTSATPLAERESAVVRLHRIGSERAVPELAKLLSDAELSHAARHALEAMPFASAGRALADALSVTTGTVRLGLVSSLSSRREVAAVPALAVLLRDTADPSAAEAAAHALGAIPDAAALAALEAVWPDAAGSVRMAIIDALLAHGWRLLGAGEAREAGRVFRSIHASERDPRVRLAADEGMIRAAGTVGLALVRAGLTGTVEPERAAALRVIEDLPQPGLGALLREVLPQLSPAVQSSVLEGWLRRTDPPSRETVRPLLGSPAVETRLAAIRGLGQVGAAADVDSLLDLAAGAEPERRVARLALTTLRAEGVTDLLRRRAREGDGAGRIEAIRALGERGDRAAARELLELARSADDVVRLAALRSIALLISEADVAELVGLVSSAPDESRRSEAGRALALTLGRLQPKGGSPTLAAVMRATDGAPPAVRAAFITASGGLVVPEVRAMLLQAVSDEVLAVRMAALNALGTTNDPSLLPDARNLAVRGVDEAARESGTRAAVRLFAREGSGVAFADRIAFFREVAAAGPTLAQRRLVLNTLAGGRSREELALAILWLDDEASAGDAAAAVVRMAPRLPDARRALAALRRVQAMEVSAVTKEEVASAIDAVEARAAHVTSWLLRPTIEVSDRGAKDLLDTVYEPEGPAVAYVDAAGRARLGKWELMRVAADARNPRQMRGGSPGVSGAAYAHTWIWSVEAGRVKIELQHDAALKLWVGDTEVARLTDPVETGGRGTASAEADLAAGWNLFRVKLVQAARPWWFSLRVRAAAEGVGEDFIADAQPADLRAAPQP